MMGKNPKPLQQRQKNVIGLPIEANDWPIRLRIKPFANGSKN